MITQIPLKTTVSLPKPRIAKVSPDGKAIAYSYSIPNFKLNKHQGYLSYYNPQTKAHHQLTPNGDISQFEWFDSQSLIVQKIVGEKSENQLFLFKIYGEPIQLTDHKGGVDNFRITSNGVLYKAKLEKKEQIDVRKDQFGDIVHVEQEISQSTLFYFNIEKFIAYLDGKRFRTEKEEENHKLPIIDLSSLYNSDWHIINYHANSSSVLLQLQEREDLFYMDTSQIKFISIDFDRSLEQFFENKDENKKKLVDIVEFTLRDSNIPKGMNLADINDSRILLLPKFRDTKFYTQNDVSWMNLSDIEKPEEEILSILKNNSFTKNLDRSPLEAKFYNDSILLTYPDYSKIKFAIVSMDGNVVHPINSLVYCQGVHTNGSQISFVGTDGDSYQEVYILNMNNSPNVEKISNFSKNIANWSIGSSESVRWKASDGLEIEGVLHKPVNFDPHKKYPLLIVVHGGPTWISNISLWNGYDLLYYPTLQFTQKGFLVLLPNYRGSIGRGQKFAEIYGDNMGYGEMDDIHSGIDFLDSQGIVDTSKIGCMGWSQGGYISAFLSTHSDRFKAISMGAGVSNWYNYYISNDIRQWTLHYMGDPYDRKEYYEQTAPINKIRKANTPLLIQHGENDQRVPLSNAYEMHRALLSQGVPTELFVFKGMPHSITKPKENLAVVHQNLNWFSHYLLGEPLNLVNYKVKDE